MRYLIKEVAVVNEGQIVEGDVLLNSGLIERVERSITTKASAVEIDGRGLHLLPGLIDDQVHFREPGLTYKADIGTESRAAVAGGITSFMEMPNTVPATITVLLLDKKIAAARGRSAANYSFYVGATGDNLDELQRVDYTRCPGIKAFLGSSTGSLLVPEGKAREELFSQAPARLIIHSEREGIVQENLAKAKAKYCEDIPFEEHARIRSVQACLDSTEEAVYLAKRYNTKLHVLHLTTQEELALLEAGPLESKLITAEVCIHHLLYSAEDYQALGGQIKCNPAVKAATHREALWEALLKDKIDVVATDHAPHTWEEKNQPYLLCPSGLPLVQHSLPLQLEFVSKGRWSLTQLVEKSCHAPARLFGVKNRGYIREGYAADVVLVDTDVATIYPKEKLLSKCGWSTFDDTTLKGKVLQTYVNGQLVYQHDRGVVASNEGELLQFAV